MPNNWLARPDGPERATTRRFRPPADIFKTTNWTDLERPKRLLAQVLNGGAKLASLPDFKRRTAIEKLELLNRYVLQFQPARNVAKMSEVANKNDFDTLLCAGAGVCRHNSLLAATLFSELGYPTRMMVSDPRDAKYDRHAWVEVDMVDPKGNRQTFVVDPSYGKVYSMAEVTLIARKIPLPTRTTITRTTNGSSPRSTPSRRSKRERIKKADPLRGRLLENFLVR